MFIIYAIPVEFIIVIIAIILGLVGGPNMLNIVTTLLSILNIVYIIVGIIAIIVVWDEKRYSVSLVIGNIFRTAIIVAAIIYIFNTTNEFKNQLLETFNKDWFEYMFNLFFGCISYVFVTIIDCLVVAGMSIGIKKLLNDC